MKNIAIIGASGALGRALTDALSAQYLDAQIHAFSRTPSKLKTQSNVIPYPIDYCDEPSIKKASELASLKTPFDMVIVTNGILHTDKINPEKSLKDLSEKKLLDVFHINTVVPTMIAKYFLPKINKKSRSVFAALTARVGSISDNHLGGWYAYRASKAALNMIIKTASIEVARTNKHAIVVALHPGTVDSPLSKPFQSNVPKDKLFSPHDAAIKMIDILNQLTTTQNGKIFAWNGEEILP